MYFGHKHAETGASCSHELVTFPKYNMPLSNGFVHSAIFSVGKTVNM